MFPAHEITKLPLPCAIKLYVIRTVLRHVLVRLWNVASDHEWLEGRSSCCYPISADFQPTYGSRVPPTLISEVHVVRNAR
jgi:hypothetical protein